MKFGWCAILLLAVVQPWSLTALAATNDLPALNVATLTPSDAQMLDAFGVSIAASDDTVAVGASCSHFTGSNCGPGAVYVFVKPSGGWTTMTQTAKLTASDGNPGDNFGISVSVSGDTIVVGADLGCVTGQEPSKAYVFVKPQTGWQDMTQTAELTPSDGPGCLGYSVGVSENAVIAGAPYASANEQNAQGAAYFYLRPPNGWQNMTETAKFVSSDGERFDELGSSVAISGGAVVAGAPLVQAGIGAAYVFTQPVTKTHVVTETAKLTASPQNGSFLFGSSVSISGSALVVGEPGCLADGDPNGNAYIFVKPLSGWMTGTQTATLSAPDGKSCDEFPAGISLEKNVIVASETRARNFRGAVYLFTRPSGGWQNTSTANFTFGNPLGNDVPVSFGFSTAYQTCTLAVGAPGGSLSLDYAFVFTGGNCSAATPSR